MPTRSDVLELTRDGASYEDAGRRLGIVPGMAYLIATGIAADGGDVLSPEERDQHPGTLDGSTQHLVNPRVDAPQHTEEVKQWMRLRAQLDGPMQAADNARTAEPPPIEGEEETDDVASVLGWDHNQVKFLEQQLKTVPGVRTGGSVAQQHQRKSIVDMITVRLSEHEVAEEGHFWPAIRERLSDGDRWADQANEQEQHGKDLLHELGDLDGTEEQFDELVEELTDSLRAHVAFEDLVFLKLEEVTSEEERADLGRKIRKAKKHAPTRPHPHAPDEGMTARLAARSAAPIDKARDAVGQRPAKRKGQQRDAGQGDAGQDDAGQGDQASG